jgi:hypothetical protein
MNISLLCSWGRCKCPLLAFCEQQLSCSSHWWCGELLENIYKLLHVSIFVVYCIDVIMIAVPTSQSLDDNIHLMMAIKELLPISGPLHPDILVSIWAVKKQWSAAILRPHYQLTNYTAVTQLQMLNYQTVKPYLTARIAPNPLIYIPRIQAHFIADTFMYMAANLESLI